MSNEEAIRVLNRLNPKNTEHNLNAAGIVISEALSMATKALEQQPCDDVISRQAVLDWIRESVETYHNQYTTDMLNMWGLFTQHIKEIPSATPQQKSGKWSHDGSHWKNRFICSECGYKLFDEPTNFCPSCGAKMQESEEQTE